MDDAGDEALYGIPADRAPESKCEMIRVPREMWPALESSLKAQGNFAVAWLQEVCKAFPGCSLLELQQSRPRLFPSSLQTFKRAESIQDYLVLQSDMNITMRKFAQLEDDLREGLRETELAAFKACRFQRGFASEGMLCNEPPIPLRVLDFLEAQDLVSLSLVSKTCHQAAHVLFKREEAVTDHVGSISLPCSTAHPHPKSRAQILRGIRIGSLMHGTPEAIPIRQGTPRLLSFNADNDAREGTAAWSCRSWSLSEIIWFHCQLWFGARDFKMGARHFGPGNCERWTRVLEAAQLQVLQKTLSNWMTTQTQPYDDVASASLEVLLLVQRAISEGETVPWWDWAEFPEA